MPQPFRNAVITNKGAELLTKAQTGEVKLEFTKAEIGDGTYSEEEKAVEMLQKAEALRETKNTYTLSAVERHTETSVKITALFTNVDPVEQTSLVAEGYYINEIGLFAKPKDAEDGEVLYCIAVTAGDNGDFFPPYNGFNPAQITQEFYVTVSNSAEVTVVMAGAAATAEQVKEVTDKLDNVTQELTTLSENLSHEPIECTLSAEGWSGEGTFTQTVSAEGLKEAENYLLVSLLSDTADAAAQKAYMKAFGIVASGTATVTDGSATFKVYKKPTTEIKVGLKGGL